MISFRYAAFRLARSLASHLLIISRETTTKFRAIPYMLQIRVLPAALFSYPYPAFQAPPSYECTSNIINGLSPQLQQEETNYVNVLLGNVGRP